MLSGDPQARAADTMARLRAAGLRVTRSRHLVVRVLADPVGHLPAERVHAALVAHGGLTDLATVHRTLGLLGRVGIAHSVPTRDGQAFGLADHPHAHAVCRTCGTAYDAALEGGTALAGFHVAGFQVEDVVLQGRCEPCGDLVHEP